MYGLTSTLSLASEALNAEGGAIAVTTNNVSNVNTPGYSRQVVNLSASSLLNSGSQAQGNGVTFGGYTSVRDQVLQISINQKTSDLASWNAQKASWSQVETTFSNSGADVGTALSNLFSGLSALSTSPQSAAARQSAYSAAGSVVNAFHQAASALSQAQTGADSNVSAMVAQVNQLSTQIAALNAQMAQAQGPEQDGGSLQDQRDSLTTQLHQLMGVTTTTTESTPTLALNSGSPLVIGDSAYSLRLSQGSDGKAHVLDASGTDVTGSITGGSLGGALAMRDKRIPAVAGSLDQFASQFATAVNNAQAQGYALNGSTGQPLFGLPVNGTGYAAGLSLSLTSASQLALSSDASAGSSGNLSNLLAVQTNALPSGQTPSGVVASLAETIGTASSQAGTNVDATTASLNQLTALRSGESGVSIDEETTHLLRYQQAYSAAAQVISTINNLFTAVMNMSR